MKPGCKPSVRGRVNFPAILSLVLCLLLLLPSAARGQNENTVTLSTPDLNQFPLITAYFWPVNAEGDFIQDLQPADVKILENSRQVAVGNLELIEPGIHFVVAVNEGPTLANRYAGVVRFDTIKKALTDWIGTQSSTTSSDFSLVNNSGSVQSNLANPTDWQKALQDYQPDLRAASPGMASLNAGIDTAAASGDSSTRTKALLYITPLPEDAQLTGIQDAAKKAATFGVRLFIWLIGPQNYSATQAAMVLQKAAADTGGNFFLFSGAETLPEIASYLNPLRYVYQLSYATTIKSSGNFDLALEVNSGGVRLTSNKVAFDLKVQPPNPIFLSPPVSIHRTWVKEDDGKQLVLSPINTEVKILLEFPDGHTRSLAYSRLFVDGKLESENTTPPFDTFGWNLGGYASSGTHLLQVTIEDQVGLSGQTIEIPVNVQVDALPRTRLQKVLDWFTPLRAVLIGLAAAVLVIVVVILVRKSRLAALLRKKMRRRNDPVTQVVEVIQETPAPEPVKIEPDNWPRGQGGSPAAARLRLCDADTLQPLPGEGFALTKDETVLGSNPKKVDILLSHESVSEVHAFIRQEEDRFRLVDAGSASGTWVNYAPVPVLPASRTIGAGTAGVQPANEPGGILLEHGDLIHVGRVPLIFENYKFTPRRIEVLPFGDLE